MAEINTLEEQVALSDFKTAAIGGQSAYLGADSQAGMYQQVLSFSAL